MTTDSEQKAEESSPDRSKLFSDDEVMLYSNPDAVCYTFDEEWLEESKQEKFFTSFVSDFPLLKQRLTALHGTDSHMPAESSADATHDFAATHASDEPHAVDCDKSGAIPSKTSAVKCAETGGISQVPCSTAVPRINAMLGKYQEKPELLDAHLEVIVTALSAHLQTHMAAVIDGLAQAHESGDTSIRNAIESRIIQQDFIVNCAFRVLAKLIDVRGYKTVVRYLPHDVRDFEPVWDYWRAYDEAIERQKRSGTLNLNTSYGLPLWMSIIILVPFSLDTVDSTSDGIGGEGIIAQLLDKCKTHLANPTKVQRAIAALIGKIFSRPDFTTDGGLLTAFIDYCIQTLAAVNDDDVSFDQTIFIGIFSAFAEIFKHVRRDVLLPYAPRVLETMKRESARCGDNSALKKLTVKLIQRITLVFLKPVIPKWRYQKARKVLLATMSEPIAVTVSTTATTEVGCDDSKAVEMAESMSDSSIVNEGEDDETAEERSAEATAAVSDKRDSFGDEDMDEYDIPECVDESLDFLLTSLRNKNTVVRWTAAKGIGRIAMRLTRRLADQIVSNLLALLSAIENAEAWHGSCLCLAELSRRGLLLPSRLPQVMERMEKATLYDKFLGTYAKGDQVRDSACYVLWAFARAYDPSVMQPFVWRLAKSLLTMACFDREIHCRRAACAALQENVGRLGKVPHGIEAVTTADYWSVALLSRAYSTVATSIARFEDYRLHLLQHLVRCRLTHWDLKIRRLAAKSLNAFTELAPDYVCAEVLPVLVLNCESAKLPTRHGALVGLSSAMDRLSAMHCSATGDGKAVAALSPELQKALRNVVPKLEKARGYMGRGGEYVREGVCLFLQSLVSFEPRLALSNAAIDRYQQTIDDCLRHAQGWVQAAAVKALAAVSSRHYALQMEAAVLKKRLQTVTRKWCGDLKSERNASVTRGYARALGVLAPALVLPELKLVVDALISKSLITEEPDFRDYLTRKACVEALADLFDGCGMTSLGIDEDIAARYEWTADEGKEEDSGDEKRAQEDAELRALGVLDVSAEKPVKNADAIEFVDEEFCFAFAVDATEDSGAVMLLFDRVLSAMLNRFEDYEVDRRGDVGSFVREHGLKCVARVAVAIHKHESTQPSAAVRLRQEALDCFLCHLLRQLSEKLDRVRRAAGLTLEWLFEESSAQNGDIKSRIKHSDAICRIFEFGSAKRVAIDWAVPAQVFPKLVQCLQQCATYRRAIVEGLLQSLGALSADMCNVTMEALRPFLREASAELLQAVGGDLVYCVAKRNKNALFQVPFFKAMGTLLSTDTVDCFLQLAGGSFPNDLLQACKKAVYMSEDIRLLLTSVNVFIGLALFESTKTAAFQKLLIYLGYKFPKLRAHTAERLYTALLTWGSDLMPATATATVDEVSDFLLLNSWTAGMRVAEVRGQRDTLYKMLEVPRFVRGKKSSRSPSNS